MSTHICFVSNFAKANSLESSKGKEVMAPPPLPWVVNGWSTPANTI